MENVWNTRIITHRSMSNLLRVVATLEMDKTEYRSEITAFLNDYGEDDGYSPANFGYKNCRSDQLLYISYIEPGGLSEPPGGESACMKRLIDEAEKRRMHLITQVQPIDDDYERLSSFLKRFGFERVELPDYPSILLMRRHSVSLDCR